MNTGEGGAEALTCFVNKLKLVLEIRKAHDSADSATGLDDLALVPVHAAEWRALSLGPVDAIKRALRLLPPSIGGHRVFWRVPRALAQKDLEWTIGYLEKARDGDDDFVVSCLWAHCFIFVRRRGSTRHAEPPR